MNVVLIGSGNVATVLGRLIKCAGYNIVQVFSKQLQHAEKLASSLEATAISTETAIAKNADIYIISVPDDEIEKVAKQLNLGDKILVHTSGSVSKETLKKASANYGVLYPLQSLRKELAHIPEIPFLIDGNNDQTLFAIEQFAKTFSQKVQRVNDEQRLKLHVAAVIVSNFTNHLYALASGFCKDEGTDFSILAPLIAEVAQRVSVGDPKDLQTGPAIRNDEATIQKHLEILTPHTQLRKLYKEITESIQKYYDVKQGK